MKQPLGLGQRLCLALIGRYQRGGGARRYFNLSCNFEPSCSEYTRQAIARFGARRGIVLGWQRIRRCSDPDCPHIIHDPIPREYP